MPRQPRHHLDWGYDPRPLDQMTLRVSYDYSAGRYRLSWTLRRNGDALPERGSTEGLLMDDVADLVAVILSSCARDDASPFEG